MGIVRLGFGGNRKYVLTGGSSSGWSQLHREFHKIDAEVSKIGHGFQLL